MRKPLEQFTVDLLTTGGKHEFFCLEHFHLVVNAYSPSLNRQGACNLKSKGRD